MASKEDILSVAFEIVAYAGEAQSDLIEALDKARSGDFEQAHKLHSQAEQALIGAHHVQTKLLSQEADGADMNVSFLMVHAQDTLMTAMMLEKQTVFMIDAYERLARLEEQLG
ncbi:PTS lactose/cellobiose transporter subunit IIA [Collinsella sp. zg1085]|uniref:PTS lactose/cellobiose transporter subunit IIA n=1 Tax=Collinsella sp. zg1085 TaxID=2844380 RepID=UPI001C0E417B|nr:PTS lactose/cellobiose transporter subunit IIA [Collinsella sp. zg1085]QWT17657.1 PTS lactose/cellobiose transporter subunit IIA [Collinsella sp. zg1085]